MHTTDPLSEGNKNLKATTAAEAAAAARMYIPKKASYGERDTRAAGAAPLSLKVSIICRRETFATAARASTSSSWAAVAPASGCSSYWIGVSESRVYTYCLP